MSRRRIALRTKEVPMCYEFDWAYQQRRAEEARRELERREAERRAKEEKPKAPVPDRSRDAEPVPV
jgi:hypothetical protein